jgi:Outer membrane protein beta-barrel domain
MRVRRLVLALALSACLPPEPAHADWLVTPFIGLKFGAATSLVDLDFAADTTKLTIGGSVAVIGDGFLGFEADFGYTPGFFNRDVPRNLNVSSNVTTLTGNVLVLVPRAVIGESLRPYVVGGAGWMHAGINDVESALPVSANVLCFNVGGGAIGPISPRTSLRFELRYFRNLTALPLDVPQVTGGSRLSFWRATVGVAVHF